MLVSCCDCVAVELLHLVAVAVLLHRVVLLLFHVDVDVLFCFVVVASSTIAHSGPSPLMLFVFLLFGASLHEFVPPLLSPLPAFFRLVSL